MRVNKKSCPCSMYISPVDILDISPEDLENIDQKTIIRLEKRLKIQRLQNQDEFYNLEEMHMLLEQLKDPEKRKVILFIEKHPNFKEFIRTGNDSGPSTFSFENEFLENLYQYADFLAPYLDTYFFPLLKEDYQKRKYDTIIQALKNEAVFTSDLLLRCFKYLEQQTIILIETIKVTKSQTLYFRCPQVTYDTHVELLNLIPNGISSDLKLDYVNALVDYYNRTKINNSEYNKIKKAYRLFKKIKTGDSFVEDQFIDLASLGYQGNNYDTDSGSNLVDVIRVLAFIAAVVLAIARFANSSSSNSYNTFDSNSIYSIENINENVAKIYKSSQREFIWDLYQKAKDSSYRTSKKIDSLDLKTGDRAFDKTFDHYYDLTNRFSSKYTTQITDSVTIKNTSDKSLILFTKYQNHTLMKSVFINSKDSLRIAYETYCRLIFYLGKDFKKFKTITNNTKKYFTDVSLEDTETLLKTHEIYGKRDSTSHVLITNDSIKFQKLSVKIISNSDYTYKRKYNTSTSTPYFSKEVSYDDYKRSSNWNTSKTDFFKKLNTEVNTSTMKKITDDFSTGDNLYPEHFKNHSHVDISGYPVLIKNQSNKHLVVFNRNLSSRRDFTFYIKPHDELKVFLFDIGDSLYFYRGKHFYNYQDKPVLKQDLNDVRLFSKPVIVKAIREEDPYIKVKEIITEISGLRY